MDVITFNLQNDSPEKNKGTVGDICCYLLRKAVISGSELGIIQCDDWRWRIIPLR